MPRSRRLAPLALLPLLVAGAAACGGGSSPGEAASPPPAPAPAAAGTAPDPTAAADAAFLTRGAVPTCGAWREASRWLRQAFAEGAAQGDPALGAAAVLAHLDRECARLPQDATVLEPLVGLYAPPVP